MLPKKESKSRVLLFLFPKARCEFNCVAEERNGKMFKERIERERAKQ